MKTIFFKTSAFRQFKNFQTTGLLAVFMLFIDISFPSGVEAQHRAGSFRSPSWHYSHLAARGAFRIHAPFESQRFFYNRRAFYFHQGLFYRPYGFGYRVICPPFGLRIAALPVGWINLSIGGIPYYYYCGTFYAQKDGQYEVVAPPVGAVVESLPKGYDKIEINGQTFYICDGVQYKPIMKENEIWYEVIKSPIKAPGSEYIDDSKKE